MEFEFLVEDGEFFVEDAEVERLMEETGLSEDEVMELIAETLENEDLLDEDGSSGRSGHSSYNRRQQNANTERRIAELNVAHEKADRLTKGMDPANGTAKPSLLNRAQGKLTQAGNYVKAHPAKTALAAGAILGTGAVAAHVLKKRKAKKEEDKDARSLKECMIDIILDENEFLVSEDDMDFLLEACDYELSEAEILENISYELMSESRLSRRATDNKIAEIEARNAANKPAPAPAPAKPAEAPKPQGHVATKEEMEKAERLKAGMDPANGGAKPSLLNRAQGKLTQVGNYVKANPGKVAVGAALGAGAIAGGAYLLKKRKAKKEADREAQSLKECMIDILLDENEFLISESDMDFLLEACDYELSEEEILDNIAEEILYESLDMLDEGGSSRRTGHSTFNRRQQNAKVQIAAPVQAKPQGHVATKEELEKVERLKAGMDPKNGSAKLGLMTNAKRGLKKAGKYVQEHPGKSALAAGAVLGSVAGGAYLLKKRKAKKEADREAQSLKECMIDILLDEEENILYVENQDIDFLLEACDYELSEAEILDNIWTELCEGKYGGVKSFDEIVADKNKPKPEIKKISNVNQMSQELVNKAGLPSSKMSDNLTTQGMGVRSAASPINSRHAELTKEAEEAKEKMEMLKKEKKEINKAKRAETTAKLKEKMGKAGKFVSDHKKQIGIGAAVAGGALATGLVAHHILKKRKAKKEADKEAQNLKECMIDLVQEGEYIYISESDMDFLLEACDYSLTEDEILMNLAESAEVDEYFPGSGIVAITSDKYMASLPEYQSVDMDEEHCDNGMMADCSVSPRTKQRIKKPKCMHEDVEYDEYSESFEGDHLINEAILTDCNIQLTEDEMFDLISENLLSERSIVRLDKAAKRSQAEAKALVVIAREQNDPLYKKLVKCYKQKQAILNQLDTKYGSRAVARVRKNSGKMNIDK